MARIHSTLHVSAIRCWAMMLSRAISRWHKRLHVEQGIDNAHFICHDSSIPANNGHAHIPAEDNSFDLLVCSKGPFHWVEDAHRVARSGATLIMLIPDTSSHARTGTTCYPRHSNGQWAPTRTGRVPPSSHVLSRVGSQLHSWWSFDVPEYLQSQQQLYIRLTWGHTLMKCPPIQRLNSF